MKNLFIYTLFIIAFFSIASCDQEATNNSEKKVRQNPVELCSCLGTIDRKEVLATAKCLENFAKNNGYTMLEQDPKFMIMIEEECPAMLNLVKGEITGNKTKIENTQNSVLDQAAAEFCGCMEQVAEDLDKGKACIQRFSQKLEYQSIKEDEFMDIIANTCSEAAHKFNELARQ